MIEMIVVMAIIVILLGIVVVGFKHVSAGNQKRQTQTLLERLKNVAGETFANKETATRFFQSQVPYVYTSPPGAAVASNPATRPPATAWDAVPAAADDTLYRTALILKAFGANPSAKAIFEDLPSERKKVYYFDLTTYAVVAAGAANSTGPFTLPLDTWGNPIRFVYDNWQTATSGATAAPQLRAAANGAITAGGLTDLYSDSAKTYWELNVRPAIQEANYTTAKYVRPTSYTPQGGAATPDGAFRSPDHLPFWFSAGPDGNFATHDDNVYSFEN